MFFLTAALFRAVVFILNQWQIIWNCDRLGIHLHYLVTNKQLKQLK